MNDFVEMRILTAVRLLLEGRVNELLGDMQFTVPLVAFDGCGYGVCPEVALSACERTEKERIVKLDAYSVSVMFAVPETPESELHCYAYAAAVDKALGEDVTLGGVADRAVIVGKRYVAPKKAGCGFEWEIVLTLRVTLSNEQVTMNSEHFAVGKCGE